MNGVFGFIQTEGIRPFGSKKNETCLTCSDARAKVMMMTRGPI